MNSSHSLEVEQIEIQVLLIKSPGEPIPSSLDDVGRPGPAVDVSRD